MLISLELTNFRKHESLTINFTSGLNVIRAPNEGGKSTMLEALRYAWWGARALPFSLEDTVTWGKPASALKVKHVFAVSGAEFTVTRSKSGAELIGPGVTVSGHEAVTNFITNLFGADSKVGTAVFFAQQGGLQHTLDGTAVNLIEQLSGMDVIDSAIVKMQAALPNGNTRPLEAQIAGYATLEMPAAPDDSADRAVDAAAELMQTCQKALLAAEKAQAEARPAVDAASAEITQIRARNSKRELLQSQIEKLSGITQPVKPELLDVAELRAKQEHQKSHTRTLDIWRQFTKISVPAESFEFDAFASKMAELRAESGTLNKQIVDAQIRKAGLKAMLITESACGLCGKDLQNVPEVVEKNANTAAAILEAEVKGEEGKQKLVKIQDQIGKLDQLLLQDAVIKQKFQAVPEFVKLDTGWIPAKATWCKGLVEEEVDATDYASLIALAESKARAYVQADATYQAQKASLLSAIAEREALGDVESDAAFVAVIDSMIALDSGKTAALLKYNESTAYYNTAVKTAEHQLAMYKQAVGAYEVAVAQKEGLVNLVLDTTKNNALIKKLREARPIVAKGLWNNVLQGVSSIFAGIRGTESVVARDNDGFTIDGRAYKQFSGSTQDALGMAIRVMLQKTFLDKFDSIVFDEPGSGADETREEAMIAALTRVDFSQVLLVTHSNLADAHAANIITL